MNNTRIKKWAGILKYAGKSFMEDGAMNLAASIAFYTIFSLPAVLLIMVVIAGAIFANRAVEDQLLLQIQNMIGNQTSEEVRQIIENARITESSPISYLIGIGTLVISATTVFVSIQNALNTIWHVKPKPKKGWLKLLIDRATSFAMVVTMGFLLLVSLLLESLLAIFRDYIRMLLSEYTIYLVQGINYILAFAISTFIFGAIFKVLPDARLKWRDVLVGALVTTLLFTLGRILIGVYLGSSNLGTTYGAAGSLVILLVWVYYSTVILLFGAEFTKAFAIKQGRNIKPTSTAVKIVRTEVERENEPV